MRYDVQVLDFQIRVFFGYQEVKAFLIVFSIFALQNVLYINLGSLSLEELALPISFN